MMNDVINRSAQLDQESKAEILDRIASTYIEALHYDFESGPRGFHSVAEKFGWEAFKILMDESVLSVVKQQKFI